VTAAHPLIPLRLRIDSRALDLARREADLALRVGAPSEAALVGKRVGAVEYGLYGSRTYLRRHRAPEDLAGCAAHTFLALDHTFARAPHVLWQAALAPAARVAFQTNSMLALVEAARAGMGLTTLPRVLADRHRELRRVLPKRTSIERDLWLVFHRDLRRSPTVRALVDTLLAKVRPLFGR
jgi:DNA-binding transcriptional LysR family regulator